MKTLIKSILLPVLWMVYPILFLYGQNAKILDLSDLLLPLAAGGVFVVLVYGIWLASRVVLSRAAKMRGFRPAFVDRLMSRHSGQVIFTSWSRRTALSSSPVSSLGNPDGSADQETPDTPVTPVTGDFPAAARKLALPGAAAAIYASLVTVIFVLFYYLYGTLFRELVKKDLFTVEHYLLLPLAIALALYLGSFVPHLKASAAGKILNILLIVALALVTYNLAVIIPAEVEKAQLNHASGQPLPGAGRGGGEATLADQKLPDIYFILFDEYAGFDAVRQYWGEHYVDQFEQYLEQNHFFVANQSRSVTLSTITEMTSRMNLVQYPENADPAVTLNALRNNKVMQMLKAHGYTTVVTEMAFQGIKADYNFQFDTRQVQGLASDEFRQTVLDYTMLGAFRQQLQGDETATKQREIIFYSLDKITNLPGIPSPKFVYTHILLPHQPFIFDKDGNLLPPQYSDDWHYYIGQHEYTTGLMKQLIAQMLANADPHNPPVIILQSDHGARNLQRKSKDNDKIVLNGYLPNYSLNYAHMILNALYLPGFDTSQLTQDMAPIDTFAIILNHYLKAGVSVGKYQGK